MLNKRLRQASIVACISAAIMSGATIAFADSHQGSEDAIIDLLGLQNTQVSGDFDSSPTNAKLNKMHEQITQVSSDVTNLSESIRKDFVLWVRGSSAYSGQKIQLLHNGTCVAEAPLTFVHNRYEAAFTSVPLGQYFVKFTALGDTGGVNSMPIIVTKAFNDAELFGPDITLSKTLLATYNIDSINVVISEYVTDASGAFRSRVAALNSNTFRNNKQIESIVLPDSISIIDTSSFSGCTNLVNVKLPSNLEIIKAQSFENCSALENINIPESLTQIGNNAFQGCQKLKSVKVPSNVKLLGRNALSNCYDLVYVSLEDGIEELSSSAFSGDISLKSIVLPNSIKTIGSLAFYNCKKLASVTYEGTIYTDKAALLQALNVNNVNCDSTAFNGTALN